MIAALLSAMVLAAPAPSSQPDVAALLQKLPPGTKIEIVEVTESGESVGASITTSAAELQQGFNASPPQLSLSCGGSGSGGGSISNVFARGGDHGFWLKVTLLIMGGLFIAAGVAFYSVPALALIMRRASSGCFIVGACCIAAAFVIDYAIWIVMLALLGAIAYYVVAELIGKKAKDDGKRKLEALRALLEAATHLPADMQAKFKAELIKAADPGDHETIRSVLKADDLPPIAPVVPA